jgi:rhamnose transport system permease protein
MRQERRMAEAVVARGPGEGSLVRRATIAVGRHRELSLFTVMVVLGALVAIRAPQFLSVPNLTQVTTFAAIIAVAAVGQALVIITRNVDLSVESTIGLVAFVIADVMRLHILGPEGAIVAGILLGLVLGMVNGIIVAVLHVPAIVATLGTLSIYRGVDFLLAGGKQVTFTELPPGYTDLAVAGIAGVPVFVIIAMVVVGVFAVVMRQTTFGRQVYAVGSNPDAATVLGIRRSLVVFLAFSLCGLLAGVAGAMWGIYFGTINATAATGAVLQIIAACVVGGVAIFGGSGTVLGAALGALFLGFIQNGLLLVRVSQFWLDAVYGIVILVAVAIDAIILRRLDRSLRVGRRG